jgi:hypothetical protein
MKVMKKVVPFVIAALMIPGVALAKGPNPKAGTHSNQSNKAKVMYVLKGLLSNYTPYMPATDTAPAQDGSIDILVLHSNRHGKLLRADLNNQVPVTVAIGPNTKFRLKNGVTQIADGDRGAIRVRAPRFAFKSANSGDILNALASSPAHMVSDWGPPPSSS